MTALEGALSFAARGWYVFPIRPMTKEPYAGSWKEISTNDPVQVQALAAKCPNCNWALDCEKSGLSILDVDVDKKKGKNGLETLKTLPKVTSPFRSRTPRGGFHLLFKGLIPSTVGKLGLGLDTRGAGGYILLPGSSTPDGSYTLLSDGDPPPIPSWIVDVLGAPAAKREDRELPVCELDLPANVEAARVYLARAPEAIEGQGGDHQTFKVCARMRDYALSEEIALSLLLEEWNETKAFPPWSPEELQTKIRNAYSYARDRPGNATPAALFPDPPRSTDIIRCASDLTLAKIQPRPWLLGYRYLPGYVTVTISPGGTGKSLLTIAESLSIASGEKLTHNEVKRSGAVWIYNTEDPFDELDRRVLAGMRHHNLAVTQVRNLFYSSGYEHPWKIVVYDDHGRAVVNEKLVQFLIAEIKRRNVVLFVVDPLVKAHGVNENDNKDMDLVIATFSRIAKAAACAISLVHHTKKPTAKANPYGDMDAARGASAVVSAARIVHTVYTMTPQEAARVGIDPNMAPFYLRLDPAKANLSPPGDSTQWYRKHSISLLPDSEESTGAVGPVVLDTVMREDPDAVIIRIVMGSVNPGEEPVPTSALAKILACSGQIEMATRAIGKRVEWLFSKPRTHLGLTYTCVEIPGKNRSLGVCCVLAGAKN